MPAEVCLLGVEESSSVGSRERGVMGGGTPGLSAFPTAGAIGVRHTGHHPCCYKEECYRHDYINQLTVHSMYIPYLAISRYKLYGRNESMKEDE